VICILVGLDPTILSLLVIIAVTISIVVIATSPELLQAKDSSVVVLHLDQVVVFLLQVLNLTILVLLPEPSFLVRYHGVTYTTISKVVTSITSVQDFGANARCANARCAKCTLAMSMQGAH
jgi:hypothetical protein